MALVSSLEVLLVDLNQSTRWFLLRGGSRLPRASLNVGDVVLRCDDNTTVAAFQVGLRLYSPVLLERVFDLSVAADAQDAPEPLSLGVLRTGRSLSSPCLSLD